MTTALRAAMSYESSAEPIKIGYLIARTQVSPTPSRSDTAKTSS